MPDYIAQAAGTLGTLSAFFTALFFLLKPMYKAVHSIREISSGVKVLLKSDICRVYHTNCEKKQMRQYELMNLEDAYAAYRALGGNGAIESMYNKMKNWDIIP